VETHTTVWGAARLLRVPSPGRILRVFLQREVDQASPRDRNGEDGQHGEGLDLLALLGEPLPHVVAVQGQRVREVMGEPKRRTALALFDRVGPGR
jgi:hypothetical protein